VRPFPKPGPRCDRKQRKEVDVSRFTDSPIMYSSEQEAHVRTAVKKEYCKGAKHYRCKISKMNITKSIYLF